MPVALAAKWMMAERSLSLVGVHLESLLVALAANWKMAERSLLPVGLDFDI